MKIHPRLILLSGINFLGAFIFYTILNKSIASVNDLGLNIAIGWIIWLGIFAIVFPALIRDDIKRQWFTKEYIFGTVILFFLNIFIPGVVNFLFFKSM